MFKEDETSTIKALLKELGPEWVEVWEEDCGWLEDLDDQWAAQNDPIRIERAQPIYSEAEDGSIFCLYIKETRFMADGAQIPLALLHSEATAERDYLIEEQLTKWHVSFTLPCSKTAEWDRLIDEQRAKWGLQPFSEPHKFYLATVPYGEEFEFEGVFFYGDGGLCPLDRELEREPKGCPVWFGSLIDRSDTVFPKPYHYIYLRDMHGEVGTSLDLSNPGFQIEGVQTGGWDRLLEAKCKKIGIPIHKPGFHAYKYISGL